MAKVVGIDLGTTNSEVAVIKNAKPVIIPVEGSPLLPSVVGLNKQGEVMVGRAARNQYILDPENTIRSIKRKMGTEERVTMGGKEYTPPEISAFILKRLKSAAEDFLSEQVGKAVITVPAYFSDSQRQATKDAGEIAGLEVVRIINEPTAAALAYGLDRGKEQRIMVYDLGGGTFDVSIVEINSGVVEVLASHGNNHLGGDDFDNKLIEYIISTFKEEKGEDLKKNRKALARITFSAERAKVTLSNHPFASVKEEFIARKGLLPLSLKKEIARSDFEQMIEELLQSTIKSIEIAMRDANLKPRDLDQVILVGGSTRIPRVSEIIREKVGLAPHSEINPDQCVALGAAIQAGIIEGEEIDAILVDVCPYSLGISVVGEKHGKIQPDMFSIIIPRNTAIPVSKSEVYSTLYDNQEAVEIEVYQGENVQAHKNVLLGKFILEGIPSAPAGEPKIIVNFDYDINGIVRVTAQDKKTQKEKKISISASQNRLTEDEKKSSQQRVSDSFKKSVSHESAYTLLKKARKIANSLNGEEAEETLKLVHELESALESKKEEKILEAEEKLLEVVYDRI